MNVYGEVYLITNKKNNKKYVGITSKGYMKRFAQHCKAESYIGSAIRKYGKNNFKVEVIDYGATVAELNSKEKDYIAKLETFGKGYNLTLGGDGTALIKPLNVKLNDAQRSFLEALYEKKKKKVDVRDSTEMIESILLTLIEMYLIAGFEPDKKLWANKILKLRPEYKKAVFDTNCITEKEVRKWAS